MTTQDGATMTHERPIIFTAESVNAILDGRKTMTRRVIKPQPHQRDSGYTWFGRNCFASNPDLLAELMVGYCPYGAPGDKLWVRETWAPISPDEYWRPIEECNIEYRADSPNAKYPGDWPEDEARGNDEAPKWRSPIHMPRWASRITLEIVSVKAERLQEISEEGAFAEGIDRERYDELIERAADIGGSCTGYLARSMYANLWDKINGKKYSWESNVWVWVISFSLANK